MGEIAEKDRVESTRSVLVRYGEIENQVSKSRTDETSALALFVECIKKEVDLGTYWTEFNVAWSEPIKTGYENYRIREPVMNLVYGLPLDHVMKKFPDLPAPPVLMACAQYIDQKGLDIEGVHRISGKQSDIESLKVSLELNATTVDWEQYDAHAVSSVFKAFLRDLPEPLFLFPLKDRAEYSSKPLTYISNIKKV